MRIFRHIFTEWDIHVFETLCLLLHIFYVFILRFTCISGDVIGHETGNADIDLENMDFLELTSSQEKTLFQAVSKVSADDSFVQSQSCSVVERKKSTVLAEKRVPNNLYIQNVKELHIHYH